MESKGRVDVLDEVEEHANMLHRLMKVLLWLTLVLFVLTLTSLLRSFQISASVSSLDSALKELDVHTVELTERTDAAREAAIDARDSLNSAIDRFEQERDAGGRSTPNEIQEALSSVARIENYLCGGPCG
jgi:DNA anti-recombination protein RmuC